MSIVEYGNLEYVLAYPIIVCTSLLIFSRDTRAVEGVLPGIVRKADHAWWGYDQWKGNKKRWSKLWHLRSLCQDLDKDFFWKVGGAEIFGRRVCFDSAADLFGDLGVSTGCWGIETAQLASCRTTVGGGCCTKVQPGSAHWLHVVVVLEVIRSSWRFQRQLPPHEAERRSTVPKVAKVTGTWKYIVLYSWKMIYL